MRIGGARCAPPILILATCGCPPSPHRMGRNGVRSVASNVLDLLFIRRNRTAGHEKAAGADARGPERGRPRPQQPTRECGPVKPTGATVAIPSAGGGTGCTAGSLHLTVKP